MEETRGEGISFLSAIGEGQAITRKVEYGDSRGKTSSFSVACRERILSLARKLLVRCLLPLAFSVVCSGPASPGGTLEGRSWSTRQTTTTRGCRVPGAGEGARPSCKSKTLLLSIKEQLRWLGPQTENHRGRTDLLPRGQDKGMMCALAKSWGETSGCWG